MMALTKLGYNKIIILLYLHVSVKSVKTKRNSYSSVVGFAKYTHLEYAYLLVALAVLSL